jgi:hypothetical protein
VALPEAMLWRGEQPCSLFQSLVSPSKKKSSLAELVKEDRIRYIQTVYHRDCNKSERIDTDFLLNHSKAFVIVYLFNLIYLTAL